MKNNRTYFLLAVIILSITMAIFRSNWLYILLLPIIFVLYYGLGWVFSKFDEDYIKKLPEEIRVGFIIGIFIGMATLVAGVYLFLVGKGALVDIISLVILSFAIGFIL
jgi:hypothetical protein